MSQEARMQLSAAGDQFTPFRGRRVNVCSCQKLPFAHEQRVSRQCALHAEIGNRAESARKRTTFGVEANASRTPW